MSNFLDDINRVLDGETVEAIVIGQSEWGHFDETDSRIIPNRYINVVLDWSPKVQALLNYEYDAGYGGADCHAIYLWTQTRVLLTGIYDGATWVQAIPRNPMACMPQYVGGG